MKHLLLTFCLLLLSTYSKCQLKFVNEFLNIGVGARAHGMFGSVIASSEDPTAAYWNPAGLVNLKSPLEINAMHANWFGGIANYDYIAIAKRFGSDQRSVGGITLIRMGVDNIPNTFNLIGPDGTVNVDRVTSFSTSDYGFFLSYARAMDEKGHWSLGGSLKVINRSIGGFGSAWGFGADLGVKWRSESWKFAVSARDITTTFNAWSFNLNEEERDVFIRTNNDIPVSSIEITLPRLIFGAAYSLKSGNLTYLTELNLNVSTNGTQAGVLSGRNIAVDPTFGLEVGFKNKVFVRGGLGNIQRVVNDVSTNGADRDFEVQPNVGMGLRLGRLSIDYALTNIGSVSGVLVSHIFSLGLKFDARKDKEIVPN